MPTPAITLTVNMLALTGASAGSISNQARVAIDLCNFGLYVPQIPGFGTLTKINQVKYSDGTAVLSIPLWGNDVITPSGNYYAITVYDGDGNVVQSGAYAITGSGTIDLSSLPQIFPTPDVPIPPIGNELEIVSPATPIFHAGEYLAFQMTLTQNVPSSTVVGGIPGNVYVFAIEQDGTGNRTFTWPATIVDMPVVLSTPGSITIQEALCLTATSFIPATQGVYYVPGS